MLFYQAILAQSILHYCVHSFIETARECSRFLELKGKQGRGFTLTPGTQQPGYGKRGYTLQG